MPTVSGFHHCRSKLASTVLTFLIMVSSQTASADDSINDITDWLSPDWTQTITTECGSISDLQSKCFYRGGEYSQAIYSILVETDQTTTGEPKTDRIITPGSNLRSLIENENAGESEGNYTAVYEPGTVYAQLRSLNTSPTLANTIFILGGFNPLGMENFNAMWNTLNNGAMLGDRLLSMGYDIVLLNFATASDEIVQVNALSFIGALRGINALRSDNISTSVLGISMGGLIGRYGLSYLENLEEQHNVDSLITFDTPHQGAYIPHGFQRIADDLTGALSALKEERGFFSVLAETFIDYKLPTFFVPQLNEIISAATALGIVANIADPIEAQLNEGISLIQLLNKTSPESAHVQVVTPNVSIDPSYGFQRLKGDLIELGDYPQQPRLVAFSNGNINGIKNNFDYNTPIVQYSGKRIMTSDILFHLDIYPTKVTETSIRSKVEIQNEGYVFSLWEKDRVSHFDGLEDAPGGTFKWSLALAMLDSNLINDYFPDGDTFAVNNPGQEFTFITTKSALDISVGNAYTNFSGYNLDEITPFDKVYYAQNNTNMRHTEIDAIFSENLYTELTATRNTKTATQVAISGMLH